MNRSAERFQVLSKLGSGGMGSVFRVLDREKNAIVALKTLRLLEPAAVMRFKQEFRLLADLSHPNLVKLFELLSNDESWFFTMECIDGVRFLEWVRGRAPADAAPDATERGPTRRERVAFDPPTSPTRPMGRDPGELNVERLRAALPGLVQGVVALHDADKLHRDIKPSNILVTPAGRVVLCDFGLVADVTGAAPELTGSGMVLGTPGYMSPEQATSQALTAASDWYSVGVVLCEALTGTRPPRPGAGHDGQREWVLERLRDPRVPPDLAEIVLELLKPDPARRPSDDVMLEIVGGHRTSSPGAHSSSQDFVGRERELATLRAAFDRVRAGGTVIARVHGDSGIGKSALVQHFLAGIDADEVAVLQGRCYERESVAYKALDAVVDALTRWLLRAPEAVQNRVVPDGAGALGRLFPVLRRLEQVNLAGAAAPVLPDPLQTRRRAFAAFRALLEHLGAERPVIIAIDDLQWGDADSAALLGEALRPPRPPRLLLVVAYRTADVEASPFLSAFAPPQANIVDIPLHPLGAEDALALVRSHGRALDGDPARLDATVVREAQGNPFLLTELVWHALRGEPGAPASGSLTIDGLVTRRLRELPEESRHVLAAIAVAGRPVPEAVVRRAAPGAAEALHELRQARLIRSRGMREDADVFTYHDRIRETMVALLSPDELRTWHQRLAAALEHHGSGDHEAIALHYRAAGHVVAAATHALQAAEQAERALAFDRAASMFRVALESERRADHDTSLLHARLAGALANAGRGAEAAAAYQRAIEGAFVAEALEYKRRAAEQLLRSGHVDDGLAAMRGVLAEVGMKLPGSPRQALLNVLRRRLWRRLVGLRYTRRDPSQISPEEIQRVETCWSVSAGLALVDTLCGMDFQTRYVSAALGTGNPQRIARALAVEAMYVSTGGRAARPRTDRLIAHAEQLAEASRDPGAMGLVHGAKGMTGFQQGEFRFAFDHAERALELLRNHCIGVTWEIDSAELIALWALYYLGELGELRRRVPALRLDAEERGDLFAVTSLSSGLPSAHLLAADEPDLAAREADEAVRRWGARGFHLQHYWHWLGRVQVELYRGDAAAALARIEDMWPRLGRAHLLGIQGIRFQSHDARVRARLLAVHTGVDDARAHLADVERSARVLDGDALAATRALARGFRAGLAAARGEGARAAAAYGEAVAAFEAAGMPLHAAGARYRQGVLLGGDGAAMVRDACAWLHARGAANPARFAALLAPGPAGAT